MSARLLTRLTRSQRPLIIEELKHRPEGMSVRELARLLKLSYMGVKDHCLALQKDGFLKTWRSPGARGRPLLLYRLTTKARELFPAPDNSALLGLLDAARQLYGPGAPGKLLLLYFQQRTAWYAERVRGASLAQRARWLARQRDQEGCYAVFEDGDPPGIVENHQPLQDVTDLHPDIRKMEERMFGKILTCRVTRREEDFGGARRVRFVLG